MPIKTFEQLKYEAAWSGPKAVALAAAANGEMLEAARHAQDAGIATCILIDPDDRLQAAADEASVDVSDMTVVRVASPEEAAARAVQMARAGEVAAVMKGALETAVFMRAALDRDSGLRQSRLFTHVGLFEIPEFDRLLLISDAGVVVAPDIYQKVEIVQNAIDVALRLGIREPKVAILAAAELVNPQIPTTMDAAYLSKMAERGQIRGGIVDGPLALDNAISETSGRIKGINSPVGGRADVLIVPDIEAGNLLAKAITYFGHAEMAGVVVGGSVPLIVTSRSDSCGTKLVSMALGVLLSGEGGYTSIAAAGPAAATRA